MLSCEIYEIFKNTFFTEHRWLLLKRVCEVTSLVKSCSPVVSIYLKSITDASDRCPLSKIMNNRDCQNVSRFSSFFFEIDVIYVTEHAQNWVIFVHKHL